VDVAGADMPSVAGAADGGLGTCGAGATLIEMDGAFTAAGLSVTLLEGERRWGTGGIAVLTLCAFFARSAYESGCGGFDTEGDGETIW